MTITGVRARLDSLTSLRFVAAALVFGHHAWNWDRSDAPGLAEFLFYQGPVGVSFFFILSGFVLTWSRREGGTPARLYRRRLARIYPAYLAVWVASVAMIFIEGGGFQAGALASLTLLQAWVPEESIYFSGSAVFWTLSCEAFFYALFPFLVDRLARLSPRVMGQWLAGLAVAHIGIVAVVAASPISQPVERWLIGFFPPFRLLEFIVGILIALLVRGGHLPRLPIVPVVGLTLVAYVVAGLVPFALMRTAVTLIPLALLIAAVAQQDLAGKRSILQARWFVRLGVWSYSLYLIHTLVIRAYFSVVPQRGGALSWVDAVVCLLASVVASAVLYKMIEEPAERWLRGSPSAPRWRPNSRLEDRGGHGEHDVDDLASERLPSDVDLGRP